MFLNIISYTGVQLTTQWHSASHLLEWIHEKEDRWQVLLNEEKRELNASDF
jgi:arsenate reductase-like glutaredoxin family protein